LNIMFDDSILLGLELDEVLEGPDVLPGEAGPSKPMVSLPALQGDDRDAAYVEWQREEARQAALEARRVRTLRQRKNRNEQLALAGFVFNRRYWAVGLDVQGVLRVYWACTCGAQGWVQERDAIKSFRAHAHKVPRGWVPGMTFDEWIATKRGRAWAGVVRPLL